MTPDIDVLVVGYGPVGATLAGLLARRGVRTTVVDQTADVFPLPRAAHVDAEAMRILQELGCATEMAEAMRVNAGMDFLTADHETLLEMRSGDDQPGGWPMSQFIFQPLFEQQLRDAVVAAGVDLHLGVAVTGLVQHDGSVTVTLADGTELGARFVVGCDGARSTVRRLLGVTMHDLEFEEPWLVVDLVLDRPVDTLPSHALQVCDPRRPHTVVPMPDPRFRFEFMLLPGEDAADMQRPEVVADLLTPWMPPDAARVERSAVYTFHGLVARDWRVGSVLLAGDAAHQMPPFLGQGMCSGMRDAANLAWKLDAVLHGAPDDLLDTYQVEREPHVRAIVEAAVGFGRIICTTDAEEAAGRDAFMLDARAENGGRPERQSALPVPPLAGPLVGAGGGTPSLQPRLDGRLLDEVVGGRWLVVTRTAEDAESASAAWTDLDVLVLSADQHPALEALLGSGGPDAATTVVVRPDRYLYARTTGSVEPPTLLG